MSRTTITISHNPKVHCGIIDIQPSLSSFPPSLHELELFYIQLREKQFQLLENPIPVNHEKFKDYNTSMKIFYSGKLIALQTHLYKYEHREYILKEILTIILDKFVQHYQAIPDWWLTGPYSL